MKNILRITVSAILATAIIPLLTGSVASQPHSSVQPGFPVQLNGARVEWSPPTLADLNNSGTLDIIVGGTDGKIWAVDSAGRVLSGWPYDATAVFAGTRIDSAPAVGDLTGDGTLEVVVTVGKNPLHSGQGGIVVLNRNGTLLWSQSTLDYYTDGVTDGMFASPVLGDLDDDGDLEIVAASFDNRIYAWHHDGTAVSGFPITTIDTIWSSPALADIDQDSYLEIIIGTDAGNFWPSPCPYSLPGGWPSNYCGGSLWVFNHDGTQLSGFPIYVWDIIQSSPAIADLDEDGHLDIIVGTGTFYYNHSGTTLGHRVYAWDHTGNPLPGWSGGMPVTYAPIGSPAVGDIDGDGHLEVVINTQNRDNDATLDGYLFAFNHDGTQLWSVRPTDWIGQPARLGITSPILADYDHDGDVEVLINMQWEVAVVNGATGVQTSDHFVTDHILFNPPAVADIDNDQRIEIVAAGGSPGGTYAKIFVWQQSSNWTTAPYLPWPMFHHDMRNTGLVDSMQVQPESIVILHQYGDAGPATASLSILSTLSSLGWTAAADTTPPVTVAPPRGTWPQDDQVVVTIVTSSYTTGTHDLGHVTIASSNPSSIYGSPIQVPVTLVVGRISRIYLPVMSRNAQ